MTLSMEYRAILLYGRPNGFDFEVGDTLGYADSIDELKKNVELLFDDVSKDNYKIEKITTIIEEVE